MKKERNELKIVYCIATVFLLIAITFVPLSQSDFIVPPGGMVHHDLQMVKI
ncbi:MAG: hypothetical protein NT038_09140 [Euryarchaeota archaeon]|nr:hypothetical protein [Euryarchaeota archaeon]